MRREDITTIFPEATKEQLDKIMSINGADITNAKNGVDALQEQLTATTNELNQLKENAKGIEADREALRAASEELQQLKDANALRDMREKVSKETSVPMDLLTGLTEEDCTAQANAIKEFAKPSVYPSLRDGGEPGTPAKTDTRTQFANWFNQITQ